MTQWDVDELLSFMRMGGHIHDDAWNNPNAMKVIRSNVQRKLREGYVPDMEHGVWYLPLEEKQNAAA